MNVFKRIDQIVTESVYEEMTCIFITDGRDNYRPESSLFARITGMGGSVEGLIESEYQQISESIRSKPGMSTRYLSIGFSRDHNATFMNKIA